MAVKPQTERRKSEMDDPGPNTATSLILKIVLLLVLILINAFFAI